MKPSEKQKTKSGNIKTSEAMSALIKASQIDNVFLKSCSADCEVGPGGVDPSATTVLIESNQNWSISPDKKMFICFVSMKLIGKLERDDQTVQEKEKADDNVLFWIDACFALSYSLNWSDTLSQDAFSVFCKTNAVYNAHPYFRELFHNIMIRMGLPPLQLPLLKPLTNKELDSKS